MTQKIPFFSLVLLIVAAIDSIRNLPSAALFGSYSIFFFILSAIVFLIPTALVSAELSAAFPEHGGVYHWVRKAFGEKWAMVAIWLQWINTMFWFPTILSFIAATAAYLIDPTLGTNRLYLVSAILIIFWGLTFVNLFGIRASVRVNSICASIGTVFPLLLIIVLGCIWLFTGAPRQIHVSADNIFPSLAQSGNWVSLIAIMASFLGMELSGVHVADIRDPQRNFPKAVILSSAFILFSMLFGSLSIAYIIPQEELSLISGIMQLFTTIFAHFGMEWCVPFITLLIVIGTIGNIVNWVISPAKGLLHTAEFGYLPTFFTHQNKHGVASRILIGQALIVSFFCIVLALFPSINAFYWFLTAISTELYMVMYILLFLSAVALRKKQPIRAAFKVPGGIKGLWTLVLLGLFGCTATILVSFVPPSDAINVGSPLRYTLTIVAANILALIPLFFFFRYKRVSTK